MLDLVRGHERTHECRMSNRQKYNFLAAFVKQLDQAREEQDELAGQCDDVMGIPELVRELGDLNQKLEEYGRRYDDLNQWVAQLELALEELDDDGSASAGEESDEDDDGLDDSELDGVEPPMGGVREPDGRLAQTVGGARKREVSRRRVDVDRNREYRLVGTKTVPRGSK